ncbi:UvrD-helicase domain-containing protein [Entomomonas sp. E2T0]|uniref:UvrD-helicase domain-containing protein n=1 Tax=Entomomonas sp. E2T0 TaxID=2930213 RepID=UPI00222852A2|nr:UvrD-helicase domain-containing protein [Entomomonas sp. E2T0]UYZ85359.1 UvrD-helicase domain-containing protein [Entomomonas sp. E2T0]
MIDITDEDIDLLQQEMGLVFDDARRECLKSYQDVQACPGSGKTTLVAAKLILLAKKWNANYQGVCVLSHTNVAKDEITKRLQDHPHGAKLLRYPHFIGTIHSFVNMFLGIPYCRSNNLLVTKIDDDSCYNYIESHICYKTKYYIEQNYCNLSDLKYYYRDNQLTLLVPGFSNTSEKPSYLDLCRVKQQLLSLGYHFYSEMFEYGKAYLHSNYSIKKFLRKRFPIVIIDEMQDTNKQQDELLNSIFNNQACKLQKFGDPDQAIYDSMNNSQPNESYNNQPNLLTIELSHRFSNDIANLVTGLSYNKLTLNTVLSSQNSPQHTIYLVDKATRDQVIPTFAKLCCECIPNDNTLPIKAVGAVGKKKEDSLTIVHYFPSFAMEKINNHNLNFDKLILYILVAKQLKDSHMKEPYQVIMKGIVKFCELANIELNQNSTSSLKAWFKQTNKIMDYNRWFLSVMQTNAITEPFWQSQIIELLSLFNIESTPKVTEFLKYTQQDMVDSTNTSNVYSYTDEDKTINVEVSTIHGVKGETHAATLVLETKNHEFDIQQTIDYLLKNTNKKPSGVRKEKFMKQLFVATTRPKYLVCLALDKSRFPENKQQIAIQKGWKIDDLTDNCI